MFLSRGSVARWSLMLGAFALCTTLACGGSASDDSVPAVEVTQPAEQSGQEGLAICDLLTDEEVASVLPGHDGGMVASSGGSLMEGVDSYQCSYSAVHGEDFDLTTVIVTVASTAELFEQVKPTASVKRDIYDNFSELQVADGGFSYGESDDMKVEVWKGTSLVSVNLMSADAGSQAEALVGLASTLVERLDQGEWSG